MQIHTHTHTHTQTHTHTHTRYRTLCTSKIPSPRRPPHSFHTWHRDKRTTRIHFIKMKTQSIQWAGNWKSFSLELLRVVQSLPADSTGGPGCRQPFCIPDACPSSLLAAFPSISVYLPSLLTTSRPPTETICFLFFFSRSCLFRAMFGKYLFI